MPANLGDAHDYENYLLRRRLSETDAPNLDHASKRCLSAQALMKTWTFLEDVQGALPRVSIMLQPLAAGTDTHIWERGSASVSPIICSSIVRSPQCELSATSIRVN